MKNKHWVILIIILIFSCVSAEAFAQSLNRTGLSGTVGTMLGGGVGKSVYEKDNVRVENKGEWDVNGGFYLGGGYGLTSNAVLTLTGYWSGQRIKQPDKAITSHHIDILPGIDLFFGNIFVGLEGGFAMVKAKYQGISADYYGLVYRPSLGYEFQISNSALGISAYFLQGIYWNPKVENTSFGYLTIGISAYFRLY